jgi:hypothetical protein
MKDTRNKYLLMVGTVVSNTLLLSFEGFRKYNPIFQGKCLNCGNIRTVRLDALKYNKGYCNKCESVTHGESRNGRTRLYTIWKNMIQRCTNKRRKDYCNYGGRGITICGNWSSYENFRTWAFKNGYSDNLSIDRINNNLGYYPENCQWTTPKAQANNRRSNVIITINGISNTLEGWSKKYGVHHNIIQNRLKRGWPPEKAVLGKHLLTEWEKKIK